MLILYMESFIDTTFHEATINLIKHTTITRDSLSVKVHTVHQRISKHIPNIFLHYAINKYSVIEQLVLFMQEIPIMALSITCNYR